MTKISENKSIKILLSEDNNIVCFGVKHLIELEDDIDLVDECSTFEETLAIASSLHPDVILLNTSLNDRNCIARIPELKSASPSSKLLVFSGSLDKEAQLSALRYGAVGIFLKNQKAQLLCKAIRNVYMGELWFDRSLTASINTPPIDNYKLSNRECNIACLSSKGCSAKEIGKELFISEKTVRNQLTNVFSKLGVKNQLELSVTASSLDFCKLPDQSKNRDNCPDK